MDWQTELNRYIEKVLKMGITEGKIREVLHSVGWEDEQIDGGFKAVKLFSMTAAPTIALKLPETLKAHRTLRGDLEKIRQKDKETRKHKSTKTRKHKSTGTREQESKEAIKLGQPRYYFLPRANIEIKPLDLLAAAAIQSVLPLLASPSKSVIWWHKIRGLIDYFFVSFENAVLIIGKALILPVALVSMVFSALAAIVRSSHQIIKVRKHRSAETQEQESAETQTISLETAASKFPERILLRDIFRLAARMFRTRRLRTFLTILGISVGIGTILFLVSLGYGMQNVLFEKITTEEALLTLDALPPADDSVVAIDDKLIEEIKMIDGVTEVSAMSSLNGATLWKESSAAGFVYLANHSYLRLSGLKPSAGRLPEPDEKNYAIVSSALMQVFNLDRSEDILDKKINFTVSLENEEGIKSVNLDGDFKIIGVIDDQFSVYAYIPIPDNADFKLSRYSQLKIKVSGTQFLESAREVILAKGLLVSALSETVDQAKKVFNIARLILGLFGIITLVVSAIGMLNTMTIALLERTQEVGIMKAVGASNFDVWKLFLAEAMIMGFFGGVGGIAIGYLSAAIFNFGINALAKAFGGQALSFFQTPSWFVLTIVAFSVIVGMITGLWPARRASRLDPLDALKYK